MRLSWRSAADLLQDLDAADLRHHDVQQRDVRALSAEQVHRLRGVGRGDEIRVAVTLQVLLDDLDVDRFVVHDHDAGALGRVAFTTPLPLRPLGTAQRGFESSVVRTVQHSGGGES